MAEQIDFRVKNGLTVATTATILGNTQSTSTTTGALIVKGGAGIGRDLYVGGSINATGFINGNLTGNAASVSTIQRVSTATHFLTFVDSNNLSSSAELVYTTSSVTIRPSSGDVSIGGAVSILSGSNIVTTPTWEKWRLVTSGTTSTARQGSDNNGLNFTTNAIWTGTAWQEDFSPQKKFAYIQHLGNGRHEFRTAATGTGVNWTVSLSLDESLGTFNVPVTVTNATNASSTTTGALIVTGGAGIGRDLYVGNSLKVGSAGNDATNIISANSSLPALRITQEGSGNTLLIEDSSNPDSTPFAINTSGQVLVGFTSTNYPAGLQMASTTPAANIFTIRHSNDSLGAGYAFRKHRDPASPMGVTSVQANDELGFFAFIGADGASHITSAMILAKVDQPPTTGFVPSRLEFWTASATETNVERMRLTASGLNIGGSTNATSTLDVVGTAKITGITTLTNTTSATSTVTGALQVAGGVGIGRDLYVGGTIYGSFNGTFSGNSPTVSTVQQTSTSAYYLTFVDSNNSSASAEAIYTTSSFTVIPSTGNVGIGTTNPQRRLTVQSDSVGAISTVALYNADTTNGNGTVVSFRTNTTGTSSSTFAEVSGFQSITTDHNHLTRNTNFSIFTDSSSTGVTVKLTVTGEGNVGIGTASPTSRLTVAGSASITSDTIITGGSLQVRNGIQFYLWNSDTTNFYSLYNTGASGTNTGILSFVQGGVGERLRFDNTGRVTIFSTTEATSTTTGALVVAGGVGVGGNLYVNGPGTIATPATISISPAATGTGGDSQIILSQNPGSNDLKILVAGVDTRTDGLIANDQYIIAGQRLNLNSRGNGTLTNTAILLGGSGAIAYSDIVFYTAAQNNSAQERARLDYLGNFGLGISPTSKLHVSGDARITGITTITNTINASSTTTGALIVTGGAGIGADLRVGGTIYGNISGTVTGSASQVNTVQRTTNASHVLTFVDSNNASSTGELLYTTSSFVINPSTGNVGIANSSPSAQLHVGLVNADNSGIILGTFGHYYRYIQVPAKTVATATSETFSFYFGRTGNGLTQITLYASGWALEEGAQFEIHRDWGLTAVPKIKARYGSDISEITWHFTTATTDLYDLHLSYTYPGGVPTGTANNFRAKVVNNNATSGGYFNVTNAVTTSTTSTNLIATDFNINATGSTLILNTATAISSATGALQVAGGVGIQGDLYVYKTINVSLGTTAAAGIVLNNNDITGVNQIVFADAGPGEGINFNSNYQIYESPDDLVTNTGGNLQFVSNGVRRVTFNTNGQVVITTNTNASSTTTGALVVNGGAGIGGNLYVGEDLRSKGFRTAQVVCNLGSALNSTTEIGNWNITHGAHNLHITVTASLNGYSVSKSYLLSTFFNQGSGAWFTVGPLSNPGPFTDDFALEASQINAILYLRLRKISGATLGGNHQVTMLNVGEPTDVFTPTTVTSTWTTATSLLSSTPIFVGPNYASINQSTQTSGAALSVNGGVFVNGTITATNFVGNISGTLTGNAATVSTVQRTIDALHYLTFVDANNASSTAENIYTTSTIIVNPGLGNVGIGANPVNTSRLTISQTYTTATTDESFPLHISGVYSTTGTNLKQVIRSNYIGSHNSGVQAYGVNILALHGVNGVGGTTTDAVNYWSRMDNNTGTTVTNAFNILINNGLGTGGPTNLYGLYVSNLTKGSSTNYAIYTAGTTPSYFGGNILTVGQYKSPSSTYYFDATNGLANFINAYFGNWYGSDSVLRIQAATGQTNFVASAGSITINTTTNATSTNTGALQVTGGVGIGGNLYVGGEIVAQRLTIQLTTITTTLVQTDDIIQTSNATNASSTTTGALVVTGGAGIGADLRVGGTIYGNISGTLSGNAATVSTIQQTGNASYFLTFVDSNNASATAESVYTTSTLVVNASTGNVGIGTNSPGELLHVYKTTNDALIKTETTQAGAYFLAQSATDGYAGTVLYGGGTEKFFIGSYGVDALQFKRSRSGTEFARFTSAGLLGVGTIPTRRLDVYGDARIGYNTTASANVTLDVTAGNSTQTSVIDFGYWAVGGFDASIWKIGRTGTTGNVDNFAIDFTASGSSQTRFIIDNSGNIGIGTTSTTHRLNVGGGTLSVTTTTNASSTTTGALIVTGGAGIGADLRVGGTIYGNISGTLTGNAATVSTVQRGTNASHFLTFVDSDNASATAESIYTTSSFVINPNTRNVGIGTTSPAVALDVRGVIQGQTYTVPETGGSTQWVRLGTLTIPQMGYTTKIRAYLHAGYNAVNSQDFYVDIFFKTSNSSSVDVNGFAANSWYYSIGNNTHDVTPKWVGNNTGTTATSYDLFLNLPNFTANSHYIVEMVQGVTWTHIGTVGVAAPGADSATTETSALLYNIPIANVGIGTTTPTSKLHVAGDARITGITTITSVTAATLPTTGALVVSGGVGIGGTLWVENSIYAKGGAIELRDDTTASIMLASLQQQGSGTVFEIGRTDGTVTNPAIDFHSSGGNTDYDSRIISVGGSTSTIGQARLDLQANQVFLASTQTASSTQTGALRIVGGVGIGQNLYVGGTIFGNVSGTVAGSLSNALTMNNGGSGAASGTTYDGSTARTISYNTIGAPKAASSANSIYSLDSRAVADTPSSRDAGLYVDFKTNTTDSLVDGGTYHGVLTFRSYGNSTDFSGGQVQQIAYTDNNNLWHRLSASTSTWGSWVKVIDTGNTSTTHVATANYAATAGSVSGSSGSAATLNTVQRTTDATHFLTFVDSNNPTATAESVYTTSSFVINPSTGNVGIGTTSPLAKLQINATTATIRLEESGAGSKRLEFSIDSSAAAKISANQSASSIAFETVGSERMRIFSNGNIAINTTTDSSFRLEVNGSFAATTKSFVIPHPTKPGMKLRYGSLEGPENGVYVRGKLLGSNVIELPDYWTKLVDPESITVNLTPIGRHQNLYVQEIANNKVIIGNSNLLNKDINCFYTVFAERIDVDKLQVEVS